MLRCLRPPREFPSCYRLNSPELEATLPVEALVGRDDQPEVEQVVRVWITSNKSQVTRWVTFRGLLQSTSLTLSSNWQVIAFLPGNSVQHVLGSSSSLMSLVILSCAAEARFPDPDFADASFGFSAFNENRFSIVESLDGKIGNLSSLLAKLSGVEI